jgi:hypothetical protein
MYKVNLRGCKVELENKSLNDKEFYAIWNGYTIEINKNKKQYETMCWNGLGCIICDGVICKNITQGLQEAFNNISVDIDDMIENDDEEIKYWLDQVINYI